MVVGQEYENGIIAYILKLGDIGYDANKIKGFCVSKEDINGLTQWSNNITTYLSTGETIFDGYTNTQNIITLNGNLDSAALLCTNYNGGGFTNWYLPSRDQLSYIAELKTVLNLNESNYLTSTDYDSTTMYVREMLNQNESIIDKSESGYVRAVRDFELEVPLNSIKMTFSDIQNQNYLSLTYWNTFFNSTFANFKVINLQYTIEITLYNSKEIVIATNLFKDNDKLLKFESDLIYNVSVGCFRNCNNLTYVNLQNCTILNQYAFGDCDNLVDVNIPQVLLVDDYSFINCVNIVTLTFKFATYFGLYAFKDCDKLYTMNANSLLETGYGAFMGCNVLHTTLFPMLSIVAVRTFQDCVGMLSIDIPSMIYMGSYCFYGCTALTHFYGISCQFIPERCFSDCTSLYFVSILQAVNIDNYAFYNCTSLVTSANTFKKVRTIGDYAFMGCRSLITSYFDNVTQLGVQTFQGCTSLTIVEFKRLTQMGNGCFYGCYGLHQFTAPYITEIPNSCFALCTTMYNVNLERCTKFGDNSFSYCYALTSIYFPSLIEVGLTTFTETTNLTSINLPKWYGYIYFDEPGTEVFYGNTGVTNLWCSKILKYNGFGGIENEQIAQLRVDSPSVIVTYTSDLTDKLDSEGGIYTEYAGNAAALAGGKKIGQFYRTGDLFKVVH